MRLDKYLLKKGLVPSRSKAYELIKSGRVFVNNKLATKPSLEITTQNVKLETKKIYVSRAAYKLEYALKTFNINIKNLNVLDIGSSTGGFVEVLLEKGAKNITAIDVGTNQLHPSLKSNPKVYSLERCDIREFDTSEKYDLITCDISFISVKKVLKDIKRLAKDKVVLLFKPQFEVGKIAKRDKRGVVVDKNAIESSKEDFEFCCQKNGFDIVGSTTSCIKGKDGNIEYIYFLILK